MGSASQRKARALAARVSSQSTAKIDCYAHFLSTGKHSGQDGLQCVSACFVSYAFYSRG